MLSVIHLAQMEAAVPVLTYVTVFLVGLEVHVKQVLWKILNPPYRYS